MRPLAAAGRLEVRLATLLASPNARAAEAEASAGERGAAIAPTWNARLPLIGLLLLFFGLSTALNVANPIWEGIDEPSHFQYVKYIAEQHRLPPKGADLPTLPHDETSCANIHCIARGDITRQPPLYYLLEAPFVLPIDLNSYTSWVANPYFTWPGYPLRNGAATHTLTEAWPYHGMVLGVHVMRAVSGLMGAGTVAVIYFTALALAGRRWFALAAAATAALTPGFLLTSATVNNDNGVILTSSLALFFGVRAILSKSRYWQWLVLYAAAAAAAMWSKSDAIFLVPFGIAVGLVSVRRSMREVGTSRSPRLAHLILSACLVVSLTLVVESLRSHWLGRLMDGFQALRSAVTAPVCSCPGPGQVVWGGIPNLWETYWGSYGWDTFHLPGLFYRPFLLFTCLALGGVVLSLKPLPGMPAVHGSSRSGTTAAAALLYSSFLVLLAVVLYRNIVTFSDGGTTHARFLLPAIGASSIFIASGLAILPSVFRKAALGGLFATCLSVVGYSILTLPQSFGPTAPAYGDARSAGVQQSLAVDYSNGMRLAGLNLAADTIHQGQLLRLELFWTASHQPDFDYSAFVRLNDGQGHIVHDEDHGPGISLPLLPHDWLVGEWISDPWTLRVPSNAPAGSYALEVGVYDYRDLKPVEDGSGKAATTIGSVTIG